MRDLSGYITEYLDNVHTEPRYVVEIIDNSGDVIICASSSGPIVGWSTYDADDILVEIPEISQAIDHRGGLSYFNEPEIKLADEDGSIAALLRVSTDYDIKVYFCLADGGSANVVKDRAYVIYSGVVNNYSYAGNRVTVIGGDHRAKRWPTSLLTRVDMENATNLCGYGVTYTVGGGWAAITDRREGWLPEGGAGSRIPVTFNRPHKARAVQVSTWGGAHNTMEDRDLRGPIFIVSDLGIDYSESIIPALRAAYLHDGGKYYRTTSYTNSYLAIGSAAEHDGPFPGLCFISAHVSDRDNPHQYGNASFYYRIPGLNRETVTGAVTGDLSVINTTINDDDFYVELRTGGGTYESGFWPLFALSFLDQDLPGNAQRFRAAWIEARIEDTSNSGYWPPWQSGDSIVLRFKRNPDWSGHEFDHYWVTAYDGGAGEFNNVFGAGGAETWADGAVQRGGVNPFEANNYGDFYYVGPKMLNTIRELTVDIALNRTGDLNTFDRTIKIYYLGMVFAVDFAIEDIADDIAVDVDYSFDNYYHARTGTYDYCRAWETIYATLVKINNVATSDILAKASWGTLSSAAGSWHDDHRLDFQLLDDKGGIELVEEMAQQSALWLHVDDDGLDAPIFHTRNRGRLYESGLEGDFTIDNIASGSLTLDYGEEDDLYNQFRVAYDKDMFSGDFRGEVYVDEDGGNCDDTDINDEVSVWCSMSQTKHGRTRELAYEADMIQDKATAERLLKSLAAKMVDRPLIARFTSTLTGIQWQLGDFPALDHPLFDRVAIKRVFAAGGGLSVSFTHIDATAYFTISDAGGIDDEGNVDVGDWIKAVFASPATSYSGWYRITGTTIVDGATSFTFDVPAGPGFVDDAYVVTSLSVYPAMMVTAQTILRGKVEFELTELPRNPS